MAWAVRKQRVRPKAVGRRKARRVHLRLSVSLWMVMRVVAQGQWRRVKRIVQAAVVAVQPWVRRSDFRAGRLSGDMRVVWFR